MPEAIKNSLEIVAWRIINLSRLVNDITTHQQMEMNVLKVKRANLGDIIKLVTNSVTLMTRRNNIALITNVPKTLPRLKIDSDQITQVFDNLISNAIKFTHSGGRITISAAVQNNSVIVSVADTGIGISQEDLPKIFARFYQADNSITRRYPANGLGLSIVKQIIEAQHGSISVKSKKGQGTEFTFTLPIHQLELS